MNINRIVSYRFETLGWFLPIKGTDSDVAGVVAETIFKNRVNDSSMVISVILK